MGSKKPLNFFLRFVQFPLTLAKRLNLTKAAVLNGIDCSFNLLKLVFGIKQQNTDDMVYKNIQMATT